jgi:putative hydrolase of the HAD superfamily
MCREALETMDVGTLVRPDPELRKAIESLAVPAHVFTNSTRRYAMNVLEALGVAGVFAEIFDIEFLQWQGKPSAEAFRRVLNALKLPAPVVALAEDDAASLEMGAKLGMVTIAVGVDGPARFRVRNIKQLPAFLGRAGLL